MKKLNGANTNSLILVFLIAVCFANGQKDADIINSFIQVDEAAVGSDNQIQGKMQINGVNYNAICDCNPVAPDKGGNDSKDQGGPKCDPSKLRIQAEKTGIGASTDDIRNLIGNMEELVYVNVPKFSFKCLDGRNPKAVLATPGGDAGEFILALTVYEDLVGGGKRLNQENVDTFFTQYLKLMPHPKFYMCTDDQAVSHIEKDLSMEGVNILNPRANIIPDLFKLLIKPENIGDLHLKMLIKYPEQFAIRKEIVIMFITSFYKLLWNKDDDLGKKLDLEVLNGDHTESAFVEVRSENACQAQQLAPLIKTKNKVVSIFLNHLDAVSIRRALLSQFFADKVNHHMDAVDPIKMHNRLNHHGYISLEITGSYAAKDLPFYTINLA